MEDWKIVVSRTRITSGHRTVGGEEGDRNNHGRTSDSEAETWKKIWKKIWQKIDIFRFWEWINCS